MDGLMNRSRGLAEGVVVMVCPVLLALALDKVDLKVYGRHNFMAMLTMAGVTLISGICPVLACCFSQRFPHVPYVRPNQVIVSLATLSSSCLIILACFMGQLIVSHKILIPVGALCGTFVLVQMVFYYLGQNGVQYPAVQQSILDESHEFLTGVTGILFLGLEGLALASHDNQTLQKTIGVVATISFIVCALGVCLMYLEMNPPQPQHVDVENQIVSFTLVLDSLMAFGTSVLLTVVMVKLMGIPALVLCTPPAVIIGELVYRVTVEGKGKDEKRKQGEAVQGNHDTDEENPHQRRTAGAFPGKHVNGEVKKEPMGPAASLELTRVTFTGFLAVSVTALHNTSPSRLTVCFLIFAAAAILFGISWRLLTQSQITSCLANHASPAQVVSSAKLASLCTHLCIVIATILFLAMAGTAKGK